MKTITDKELQGLLINIMSDGFNRSLNALSESGAIDTKKLRKEYHGVGSKYYDIVTEQLELTAVHCAPELRKLIDKLIKEKN